MFYYLKSGVKSCVKYHYLLNLSSGGRVEKSDILDNGLQKILTPLVSGTCEWGLEQHKKTNERNGDKNLDMERVTGYLGGLKMQSCHLKKGRGGSLT